MILGCLFILILTNEYVNIFTLQVGTMGAEGYCVNVPWSRKGVGDNDYVFAFQNVVLPIGKTFLQFMFVVEV